jgi:hypothetical protein
MEACYSELILERLNFANLKYYLLPRQIYKIKAALEKAGVQNCGFETPYSIEDICVCRQLSISKFTFEKRRLSQYAYHFFFRNETQKKKYR